MQSDEDLEFEDDEREKEDHLNDPPPESILTNEEAKFEVLRANEVNRRSVISQADLRISDMFRLKSQTLIMSLNHILQALQMDTRPNVPGGEDIPVSDIEFIFNGEAERTRLKEQYGKILDCLVRYTCQIDPKNEKPKNDSNNTKKES